MADICSLLPGARELVDALSGKVKWALLPMVSLSYRPFG